MHRPCTSHKAAAYCKWRGLHARAHTHTHTHTHKFLRLFSHIHTDIHIRQRAPHPGMWEGELGSKGIPSCSCIRQQCGQTLHSVLFFQMCLVLNSTSHNRECSEGLTVNGLQVITPPHNMYCTGTQELGTSATQTNDDKRTHMHTHTRTSYTHTQHTHTHTQNTHTHTHTHAHNRRNSLSFIVR